MPVEMVCGEERRSGILDQSQLVALRLHPEHDHVGIALAGVRIVCIGLGRTEEDERLPTHLIDGVALRALQALNVWHRRGDLVHIAYPGGSISHNGEGTDSCQTVGVVSGVAVTGDSDP